LASVTKYSILQILAAFEISTVKSTQFAKRLEQDGLSGAPITSEPILGIRSRGLRDSLTEPESHPVPPAARSEFSSGAGGKGPISRMLSRPPRTESSAYNIEPLQETETECKPGSTDDKRAKLVPGLAVAGFSGRSSSSTIAGPSHPRTRTRTEPGFWPRANSCCTNQPTAVTNAATSGTHHREGWRVNIDPLTASDLGCFFVAMSKGTLLALPSHFRFVSRPTGWR
jgi:hypothetical protein